MSGSLHSTSGASSDTARHRRRGGRRAFAVLVVGLAGSGMVAWRWHVGAAVLGLVLTLTLYGMMQGLATSAGGARRGGAEVRVEAPRPRLVPGPANARSPPTGPPLPTPDIRGSEPQVGLAPVSDRAPGMVVAQERDGEGLVDRAALEARTAALGGPEAMWASLSAFEEEMPRLFMDVQNGLEEGRPKLIQAAMNTIKTLAATFGAGLLRQMAEEFEYAAREEDLVDGEVWLLDMMEVYEEVLAVLVAALRPDAAPP